MQEVGVVGFILFISYIISMIQALRKAQVYTVADPHGFLSMLVKALQVWIFMELIYSMSCFGLSSWEWYLFGGIATVVSHCVFNNRQLPAPLKN